MEISFYQAECGDAARIKFLGTDSKWHNLFIDSGFAKTFRQILRSEIDIISKAGEHIDAWIISHIHDDHIGGAIAYLNAVKDKELKDIVDRWIYNFPRTSPAALIEAIRTEVSEAKSIKQGDTVSDCLLPSMKDLNDFTNAGNPINIQGLKISFLSPNAKSLIDLRNKYSVPSKPLERIEIDTTSEAKGKISNDYKIRIEDFNLDGWNKDVSIENASSISMLVESGKVRTLWLADAHPSIVATSLKKMGYSEENPLQCDLVKVSHHGSNGNYSDELYSMIRCNNYFFSVNGENKYCLPSKECIVRILKNKQRLLENHYNLYFPYDNELLKSIFLVDSTEVYTRLNFTMHYQSDPFKKFLF